jgi:hypothetical protein
LLAFDKATRIQRAQFISLLSQINLQTKIEVDQIEQTCKRTNNGPAPVKRRQDDKPLASAMATKKRMVDTIPTANSYERLPDNDEGHQSTSSQIIRKSGKKTEQMPPIVLVTELKNPKETYEKIAGWLEGRVYFKVVRERRMIYTYKKTDYQKVQEKFREMKFQYHTYTPKDEIPKKLILKGIDPIYTVDEIYEDLFEQYAKVKDVHQLRSPDQQKVYNIYLVHFEPDTDLSYVKKLIRYVYKHKISWEHYQKKKSTAQCRRCQRIGHVEINCQMDRRCNRCTENHAEGQCAKKEDEKPTCVNCNQEHATGYKKCEYRINYQKSQARKNRNQFGQKPTNNTNNNQQKRTSYINSQNEKQFPPLSQSKTQNTVNSNVVNNTQSDERRNEYTNRENNFSFISNEIKSLFSMSITEMMQILKTIIPQYKQLTDVNEKKIWLLDFVINICDGHGSK